MVVALDVFPVLLAVVADFFVDLLLVVVLVNPLPLLLLDFFPVAFLTNTVLAAAEYCLGGNAGGGRVPGDEDGVDFVLRFAPAALR